MNPFDAKLILTSLRMKNVLFVVHRERKHGCGGKYYYGKFYAITERQGLFEITHHIAVLAEASLVKIPNEKKNVGELCIVSKKPLWLVRNVAQELYGDWSKVNIVVLENEQVF